MKNLVKMGVSKIFIILFFIASYSFSQNKKEDVYFMLNEYHNDYYILEPNIDLGYKKTKIDRFYFYDKIEYKKREDKIKELKKQKKNYSFLFSEMLPKTLFFKVISQRIKKVGFCEFKSLKLINFEWLLDNGWKPLGNKPYEFKNIIFLYKIDKNEYIYYKVKMTVVVY